MLLLFSSILPLSLGPKPTLNIYNNVPELQEGTFSTENGDNANAGNNTANSRRYNNPKILQ